MVYDDGKVKEKTNGRRTRTRIYKPAAFVHEAVGVSKVSPATKFTRSFSTAVGRCQAMHWCNKYADG